MKTNVKKTQEPVYTAPGAKAAHITPEQQLRRTIMACLLWEDVAYEDGQSVADRIKALVPKVSAERVAELAIEAREDMKLRHVPLLLVREMSRLETHRQLVATTLERVIQRADELSEFVSIYWKEGKQPLSNQVKRGLAAAFRKFDEYALAKYNRDGAVKLRDVLFLCHAKPENKAQEKLWKRLVEKKLETPDTWEVALSEGKGENKKETWERLLRDGKMHALAFIRNLRNFVQAGVSEKLVREGFQTLKTDRVLPFRFLAAARHAPEYESELEKAMLSCMEGYEKLPGKTILVVDVSGSMTAGLSGKTDINRLDTAASLAILARGICEDVRVYATGGNDYTRVHSTALVPARQGMALRDVIVEQVRKLGGGGIFLKQAMDYIYARETDADRVIVITDEQDCDTDTDPNRANTFGKANYLVNVSTERNGIGYGKWTHIDGWSEHVLDYIATVEGIKLATKPKAEMKFHGNLKVIAKRNGTAAQRADVITRKADKSLRMTKIKAKKGPKRK